MAYIGKSPTGTGVRIRYYFTQTSGGATSISGTDDNNKTLSFSDGEYVDVYLNGVSLVAGTDYNTTTANTIGGLSALANGDVIEVVVYDIFTVADTVSQSSGGTFSSSVGFSGGATFPDSAELVFGTGSDFKISHNGSKTKLEDTGTGNLEIRGTNIEFYSGDGGETLAKLTDDGAAELYHNNTKRIETTSTGVEVGDSAGGQVTFRYTGNSGFGAIKTDSNSSLLFSAGATSFSEDMRIDSSGNLGIGITNPSYKLATVEGTGIQNSDISSSTSAAVLANLHPSIAGESLGSNSVNDVRNLGFGAIYVPSTTGTKPTSYGGIRVFEHYNGASGKGSAFITQVAYGHATNPAIYARNSDTTNGATFGTWYSFDLTSTSDERSKENVEDAPAQLALVNQFQVKEFDYIDNDNEPRQLGLMAQHVDTIAPEYVVKDPDDTDIMWRVKYNKMVPMLIKALQETTARIETLETEMTALKARVTALEDA